MRVDMTGPFHPDAEGRLHPASAVAIGDNGERYALSDATIEFGSPPPELESPHKDPKRSFTMHLPVSLTPDAIEELRRGMGFAQPSGPKP